MKQCSRFNLGLDVLRVFARPSIVYFKMISCDDLLRHEMSCTVCSGGKGEFHFSSFNTHTHKDLCICTCTYPNYIIVAHKDSPCRTCEVTNRH